MLKRSIKEKFKSVKFVMTKEALELFETLKQLFTCASILVHYDTSRQIMLKCDVSGFAIGAILSQLVGLADQWHPVVFWSRKMAPAERNYGVEKAEMLAIVKACKYWRHYLKGAMYSI